MKTKTKLGYGSTADLTETGSYDMDRSNLAHIMMMLHFGFP
jgi:hypothetical protein